MNFLYLYPTIPHPVGGMKQIRLQVAALRSIGVDAFLLRDDKHVSADADADDNRFYGIDVPSWPVSVSDAAPQLTASDVVLIPEFMVSNAVDLFANSKARLGVNNQNGFACIRNATRLSRHTNRIEFALANAPYVAELSAWAYGLDRKHIFNVPHWIIRPPFEVRTPDPNASLSVCYMPRKIHHISREVRKRVEQVRPDIPWIPIHMMTESEVADTLSSHKIFFAAQDREGCPMTALEAMACGAIVSGFPGTGRFAHPYAIPANGVWAKDRVVPDAVASVLRAIALVEEGGIRYQKMVKAGAHTLSEYTEEKMVCALSEMVSAVREGSYAQYSGATLSGGVRHWFARSVYRYTRVGPLASARFRLAKLTQRGSQKLVSEGSPNG